MALVLLGKTECPLCGVVLKEGEEYIATSGGVVGKEDPLAPYQDAAMHRNCFLSWPLRESFIRKFNEYCEQHLRGMRFMREDGSVEEREPRPGRIV
jgi:hypothetical protein